METDSQIDEAIARICMERGARAILIDIRALTGRLSVVENHLAATTYGQRLPSIVRRVAILDLPEHQQQSEIFELTARNRGASVRFFDREADAAAWLSGDA